MEFQGGTVNCAVNSAKWMSKISNFEKKNSKFWSSAHGHPYCEMALRGLYGQYPAGIYMDVPLPELHVVDVHFRTGTALDGCPSCYIHSPHQVTLLATLSQFPNVNYIQWMSQSSLTSRNIVKLTSIPPTVLVVR